MKDDLSGPVPAPKSAMAIVMGLIYRIPVIGWALEGVLVDKRPKGRLAGLFVLLAAPAVAVFTLGWWGSFVPFLTLAVLVIVALDLVYEI